MKHEITPKLITLHLILLTILLACNSRGTVAAIAVKSLHVAALIIKQTKETLFFDIYNTVLSKTNSLNLYMVVT